VVPLTPMMSQEWDHANQSMYHAHKANHPRATELLRAMHHFQTAANEAATQDKVKGTSSITEVQSTLWSLGGPPTGCTSQYGIPQVEQQ
jgi:hypothetical protein